MDWDVVISGAGLGGLCAASGFRQVGSRVLVLERDESALSRRQGYRININLAGDAALRQCLPAAHYELYQATSHRQLDPSVDIFAPDLKPVFHRTAEMPASGLAPAAVDRATLRAILLGAARDVRFGAEMVDAVHGPSGVEVHLGDGTKLGCGLLVAADGASSTLRRKMLPNHDPQPLGTVAIYGKAPLDTSNLAWIPHGVLQQRFVGVTDNSGTTLALGAWHSRRDPAEAATALVPGVRFHETAPYVMWVLIVSASVAPAHDASAEELHRFALNAIHRWHPSAVQFVRDAEVPETFRIVLRAMPSVPDWPTGRITFLGDAVHAMSPAGGEGANTAMADAAALVAAFTANGIDGIAAYENDMRRRARLALNRSANYGRADQVDRAEVKDNA
jgi:2-polyprenyl-6-methoxyphenol hydroxylase-like FAD-dependent oxidoreductase